MLFGTWAPLVAAPSSAFSEPRSSLTSAALFFTSMAPVPPSAIFPPGMLEPPPEIASEKSNLKLVAVADLPAATWIGEGDVPDREPRATPAVEPAATAMSVARNSVKRCTRMSVLPFLRLPFRHDDRSPLQCRATVDPAHDRVLHVVLVVPVRVVVRSGVRAPALLAGEAGDDRGVGELDQEPELERLRQVGVEDVALVVDDHVLIPLAQAGDDLALPLHLILAAEDAEVLVHRRRELVADRPRALAAPTVEQRLQLLVGVGFGAGRNGHG